MADRGYGPTMNSQKTNANWQNNYIKAIFVDLKSFKTNLKRFVRYLDNFQKYKMAGHDIMTFSIGRCFIIICSLSSGKKVHKHLFAALSR